MGTGLIVPRSNKRYGWVPQRGDIRDQRFTLRLESLPSKADTRPQDVADTILNQGDLGSCTANSIAGTYRYEAHKQGLPDIHPARLQIYYDERAMEGTVDSDAGAMLRDGLKVVATNGVAPEELWPYDISKFTQKPPQDVYDAALKHQALKYQAIDQDLNAMKSCLAAGFQFVFGFTVYSSFESAQVAKTGQMPLPGTNESVLGGHAVRAVGYDDTLFGGVVIVANSWGLSFGASGYFFMPYAYITSTDLASDFWTIQIVE